MDNLPAFGARATLIASQAGDESIVNPANSSADRVESSSAERRRIPMSVPRLRMSTPEIPGFHTHWLNDSRGRLQQALAAGYEFVTAEEAAVTSSDLAGDPIDTGSDLGSRISMPVGMDEYGRPLRAYLMKIREEWYKADQAAHHERVEAIHDSMERARMEVQGLAEDPKDRKLKYSNGNITTVKRQGTYSQRRAG